MGTAPLQTARYNGVVKPWKNTLKKLNSYSLLSLAHLPILDVSNKKNQAKRNFKLI